MAPAKLFGGARRESAFVSTQNGDKRGNCGAAHGISQIVITPTYRGHGNRQGRHSGAVNWIPMSL